MSTYDWLTIEGVRDVANQNFVEVSFKHGARKDFFYCPPEVGATTRDLVVVETEHGFDTGYITLSGELVLRQMKRKKVRESHVKFDVVRLAHNRDRERLDEARRLEKEALVRGRVIAYGTELPMKLTDVEYQADMRKATFYYTSETRIDFRELIKSLAREFRVRVEMRQIGARQETARLGGVGSCGRELCCSTWITEFKSVNTSAARYQGLALNQTKLSGQCGRLKCCLNYELDTYLDALQDFPKKADKIRLPSGKAVLVKTDVFKKLMHYQIMKGRERGPYVTLTVEQVHEILANPEADIQTFVAIEHERQERIAEETADEHDYGDVTGVIDIPLEKRGRKKRKGQRGGKSGGSSRSGNRSRNKRGGNKDSNAPSGKTRSGGRNRRGRGGANPKSGGDSGGASGDARKSGGDKSKGSGNSRSRSRRRGGKGRGPKPGSDSGGKAD